MSAHKLPYKTREVKIKDWPLKPKSESNSRMALRALNNAAAERRLAQRGGRNAPMHLAEVERIESSAAALMKPTSSPTVKSGEVAFLHGDSGPCHAIADTLANPDTPAIEASVARTELLLAASPELVALAVDAATSARASNCNEKMLAHQMAVIHVLVMKAAARALEFGKRLETTSGEANPADSVEFSRLAQTAGRLCSAFQEALLMQKRIRNGNEQTLTVRYVNVEAGGQGIIGNVRGGRRMRKLGGVKK